MTKRHFESDCVLELIFVRQDPSGLRYRFKAHLMVGLKRSNIHPVVVHDHALTLNQIHLVSPYIRRYGMPMQNRCMFNPVFFKIMLNESFDILDMNDIFCFHPIMDSCVSFACSFGSIAFFKNDHYVLSSLSVISAKHRQFFNFIIIDTLKLAPVNLHVCCRCFFRWIENRSLYPKVFLFARACRNLIEGKHVLFINHIPGFIV